MKKEPRTFKAMNGKSMRAYIVGVLTGLFVVGLFAPFWTAKSRGEVPSTMPRVTQVAQATQAPQATQMLTVPEAVAEIASDARAVDTASSPQTDVSDYYADLFDGALRLSARYAANHSTDIKTYRYHAATDIPSVLPGDCNRLQFGVSGINVYGREPRLLSEFDGGNLHFKVVENPSLHDAAINARLRANGYGTVAVFCENATMAGMMVMAYNPEERPVITVSMPEPGGMPHARMDVQILNLSVSSSEPMDDGWHGTNVSFDNYAKWGFDIPGESTFGPTQVIFSDDGVVNFDRIVKAIEQYDDYWSSSTLERARRNLRFSLDRTKLDLDGYATDLGYEIVEVGDARRTYRKDGREITVETTYTGNAENDEYVTKIIVDGDERHYPYAYITRIGGMSDEVVASGGIVLRQSGERQVDTLLFYLEEPITP